MKNIFKKLEKYGIERSCFISAERIKELCEGYEPSELEIIGATEVFVNFLKNWYGYDENDVKGSLGYFHHQGNYISCEDEMAIMDDVVIKSFYIVRGVVVEVSDADENTAFFWIDNVA